MERRTVLKLISIAALTPQLHALEAACPMDAGAAAPAVAYRLKFFTAEENHLLDQLMEMVIPADAHSPGAHAAKASYFADLMVSISNEKLKKQWRDGLQLMRDEAKKSSLADALAKAAQNEGSPTTDLERFFGLLKPMTINGYYTSEIGIHQDLQYIGNTYLAEFPGCTHPEHKVSG